MSGVEGSFTVRSMDGLMQIADILSQRLNRIQASSDAEWQVWEHKTFNIHRAVLEWTPGGTGRTYAEMSPAIRAEVARRLKVSWWRGMGFGIVVHLAAVPQGLEACLDDIDGRANSRGTWQWSVFVLERNRAAIGAHMWMSGYLSVVYNALLQVCELEGYQIASCKKEKDKLMRFLTAIHPLPE
jgi:hypothetical protein